jgi:hypothetical protein
MRPALFNAALGAECAIQKENIPAGQKNLPRQSCKCLHSAQDGKSEKVL